VGVRGEKLKIQLAEILFVTQFCKFSENEEARLLVTWWY